MNEAAERSSLAALDDGRVRAVKRNKTKERRGGLFVYLFVFNL